MEANKDYLPIGTSTSGFAKAKDGPFKCGNCVHYDQGPPSHCEHIVIRADFEVKKDSEGRALVAAGDCCAYFRNA